MKSRDRTVLCILGLAGLAAALWFLALAPKRQEASDLAAKVTQAEARRDGANAKAAVAEQARATYRRDYAIVARLGKATPPSADVASLVYQLESAARDAKVDFRSVTSQAKPAEGTPEVSAAGTTTGPAGITTVPFSLTFEGSFFKAHKLLRSVGHFSRLRGQKVLIRGRLLTIDGVTLSPGRAGFPRVKVEILARAYVAALPEALPDASGAPAVTAAPTSTPKPDPQVTK
jgi:Tfp pilus assembly protein PilO